MKRNRQASRNFRKRNWRRRGGWGHAVRAILIEGLGAVVLFGLYLSLLASQRGVQGADQHSVRPTPPAVSVDQHEAVAPGNPIEELGAYASTWESYQRRQGSVNQPLPMQNPIWSAFASNRDYGAR